MSHEPTHPPVSAPASPLREARYSLKELLQEVEFEREHSILGLELVDQGEIGAIFRNKVRKKSVKPPKS